MDHNELKQLRRKLDLTQCQMAERLGISLPTYGLYERGKPMHKPVALLAQMLSQSNECPIQSSK